MIAQLIESTRQLIFSSPLTSKNNRPTIIVGLSGGPDSVFALHLLHQLHEAKEIYLIAAHVDHGWRDNSASEAIFCRKLCEKRDIPFEVTHARDITIKIDKHSSQESRGRALRRSFFSELAQKHEALFVCLGHHVDDQQETFFIRLVRGSSLDGLTCMKKIDGIYLRPLLELSKESIIDYLDAHNITYLNDESNASANFLRNRIRHTVMPALKKCDSRFEAKFKSTLAHLTEANQLLHSITKESFTQVFRKETSYIGSLRKIQALSISLQKRVFLYWLCRENVPFTPSDGLLSEIHRFLSSAQGGTHHLQQSWSIYKKKDDCMLIKH